MKKLYSLVLMAAMLLVGTNVWAVDVSTWDELQTAIATPNAEITLTAVVPMPTTGGTFDFNGATILCGKYYYLQASAAKTYTLQKVALSYSGSKGAIYISKANAVVNLESTVTFNFTNKYGVYSNVAATINNEATIARIYVKKNSTINNNNAGAITVGVTAPAGYTATVKNGAMASLTQALSVAGNLTINNDGEAVINGGTFSGAVSFTGTTPVEIKGGTFNGQLSGSDITIHGGTFNVAPTATGTISPVSLCKFEEGVGLLDIAAGYTYRAFDKLVVLSNAGQVEVTHANGQTATMCIEEAFANAADGDEITLLEDVTSYSPLWLGTAAKDGEYKSVTLDLNGHTLSSHKDVINTIWLTHGALYIVNSVPGQGGIVNNYTGKSSQVVLLHGSPEPDRSAVFNSRTAAVADLFTYLLIDEGVTLSATGSEGNGFSVDIVKSGLDYRTDVYNCAASSYGVAYGVRVDMKGTIDATKYAGKVNGYVRHPNEMIQGYPCVTDVQIGDTASSTFIHIFPTAVMHTANTAQATAVYCSGYARWQIQGLCQGANGVYVKSGVVDLTDATIESTWTEDASIETGGGSGINATGYGVVIESNVHYTGQQALVIGGDTKIETPANDGAAVVDVVDATQESKVESIVINGGSFTGDNAIVVSAETASENTTTINGVTIQGDITVGGSTAPEAIEDIMGSNTHTTEVENPDGSKTVIISAGDAPATDPSETYTSWDFIAGVAKDSLDQQKTAPSLKWTKLEDDTIKTGTIYLKELLINSGTGTAKGERQQLVINDGASLQVERLILNAYARIIVEAGGKLIVEGEQGINAPVVENITLRTSEDNQAIFLFHPKVTSNRHPNATVAMNVTSYNDPTVAHFQRFGIPMISGVEAINASSAVPTGFYKFNYASDTWENIGFINYPSGTPVDYSQMNTPFEYYQLISNRLSTDPELVLTFTGSLVGNDDMSKTIPADIWYGICNSYTGNMGLDEIVNGMTGTMSKTIWTYETSGNQAWAWKVANLATQIFEGKMYVKPMQAFLIHNVSDDESATATISYEQAVWNPAMNPSPAPARVSTASLTAAKLIVSSENGYGDQVLLVQGNDFTSAYDNGYDAEKYFNGDINFYISDSRAMSVLATDNLADTYLGFSCVNGGIYTIDFSSVNGESYDLIDLEANQTVHMTEGASYQFAANDNEQNDYRFRIVARQEMPTDIETVENGMIKADGVYTITGQYLGDLNIWNTLPAGLYIVNGEKKVK